MPDGYINEPLVEAEWDEILRFAATIKLKEATASQLFKRLNSYSKQHPLYRALKEFGKIIKTLFILSYIDDLSLRQAIEKQLNKSESANKFSRAISQEGGQGLPYGEKAEQELADGCRRLIRNAIICWNYLYLSQKIVEIESKDRRDALIAAVKNGSVVTWRHLNLSGEFDLSDEWLRDSMGLDMHKILQLTPSLIFPDDNE